jgi:tetratricopeptide (TPR) repeat protein
MARKLRLTLNARESVDTESIEVYQEYSRVLRYLSWVSFGVILPLAVMGAWVTRGDWRRLWILYLVIISLVASVALFYVMARYRYPIVPIVLLFAAAAAAAIPDFALIRPTRAQVAAMIVVLLVALYSNLPAGLPGDNTKVYLGSEFIRLGRPYDAVPLLRQAVAELPDYAPAHFSLALALGGTGEHEQALAEYQTTVRLWPEDFKAQGALALALAEAGRAQEALDHFREAARLNPDSAAAQNNLAIALHLTGNAEESISHYESALALRPDWPEAHCSLALALAQNGRSAEAIQHFNEALRSQPGNADIHLNLGNLLMEVKRTPEALAQYEQAVSLQPESVDLQTRLAEAYMKVGRYADAIDRFRAAITVAQSGGQTSEVTELLEFIKTCQSKLGRKG